MRKLLIILLFLSGVLNAQITQTIKGTVLDKQTQSPLPGTVVQLLNHQTSLGATTK